MSPAFAKGDPVIYVVTKQSEHPGPRAENIHPSAHGETYSYQVDKFWRVKEVAEDGSLLLVTRTGKERVCRPDDPSLRKPGIIERTLNAARFPDEID